VFLNLFFGTLKLLLCGTLDVDFISKENPPNGRKKSNIWGHGTPVENHN